ncbi:hypothetical protein COV06_01200 [Candidatus Uhrbacteria bacterium CG10_big_fil_rev_8_21_14_0_10_50_16]|uniref:Uncharacterized protein n=1 Tax=Candidatus Uhrbacteria bacterium CG10_big_fil_rev_8_21_14_0_10_50_16 TaxID=1975039 RepID=A0A2H0RN72_9BACT|nr:MAG: hypothetical protein COV06_01200 [Candidatus Uhrbacteria bacterium CG10_big_fil_rev_8_21_14_0_10_50_16]
MKKLILSLMAFSLVGAGCASKPSDSIPVEPLAVPAQEIPKTAAPVDSAAKTQALNLMLDVGQLLVDASTAGVDATQLSVWEEEGYVGSRAIRDEDYATAVTALTGLKAKLVAAIAAAQ